MRASYGKDTYELASSFERIVVTFPIKGNMYPHVGNVLRHTNGQFSIDDQPVHGVQLLKHPSTSS